MHFDTQIAKNGNVTISQLQEKYRSKKEVQTLIIYESEDLEVDLLLLESAMICLTNLVSIDQVFGLAK